MNGDLPCVACGSRPAAPAVFIGLRGLVIIFWLIRKKGSYCRDCGIATFRAMSSLTLAQGWWFSFGLLAVPVILVWNVIQRAGVAVLRPPVPPEFGFHLAPPAPGKPVYLRASMLGLLFPLLALCMIGTAMKNDPANHVGECVQFTSRTSWDFISCDENNIGQVVAVVPSREQCPEGTVAAEEAEVLEHFGSELGSNFYCLRPASAAGSP